MVFFVKGHSEANPHSKILTDELFTKYSASAINDAIKEVNTNPEYESVGRLTGLLCLSQIPATTNATALNVNKCTKDATCRFLNRIMLLPVHIQATLFKLIEEKLAALQEAFSGYKSFRGNGIVEIVAYVLHTIA